MSVGGRLFTSRAWKAYRQGNANSLKVVMVKDAKKASQQIPILTQYEVGCIRKPEDIVRIVRAAPVREYVAVPDSSTRRFVFGMIFRIFWLFCAAFSTGAAVAGVIVYRSRAACCVVVADALLSLVIGYLVYQFASERGTIRQRSL
jgi:hypothetical protein